MYDNFRDLTSYYTFLRGSLAISFVLFLYNSFLYWYAAKDGELIIEIPKEITLTQLNRDFYKHNEEYVLFTHFGNL